MTNTVKITKEEFEELAYYPNRVEYEKDAQYGYDTVLNEDDEEIAFAVYSAWEETSYKKIIIN